MSGTRPLSHSPKDGTGTQNLTVFTLLEQGYESIFLTMGFLMGKNPDPAGLCAGV